MTKPGHAILAYLEPTPYVLGLIEEIRRISPWALRTLFLGRDRSQDWNLRLPLDSHLLAGSRLRVMRQVLTLIGDPQLRIVHLCGWGGHAALIPVMLRARVRRIPVIVESDTQSPIDEPIVRRMVKRVVYPLMFNLPTMFTPGGSRQRQYLRNYGVPDHKLRVAQMTVDVAGMSRFAAEFDSNRRRDWRTSHEIGEHATVLLFVGRLEAHKGLRQLVAAFRETSNDAADYRLVVVGDGTLRDEVSNAAANDRRIVLTGRLQGNELLEAYCSADALVLPSEFEPWGLVVNEAMACGLPVIVSERVGCVDDLVTGRDTGLVHDSDDPHALTRAIRHMLTDSAARSRMAANASRLISGWTLQDEASRIVMAWQEAA